MALWHKAWVESRFRFLIGAATLGALCGVAVVLHEPVRAMLATRTTPLDTYNAYLYRTVYGFGRTLFMILAFVLGLGGLLRERELGTAAFTLALPVSRRRLVVVRALTAFGELIALALMPALVVAAFSPLVGRAYPVAQALQFAVLWIAGGSALCGIAFLASAMFAGEYTAFLVAWVVMFGHTLTAQFIRLRYPASSPYLFTVQEIMSGFRMRYFDTHTRLLVGPFPLMLVAALSAIAIALVASAAVYTDRKDF